MDENKPSRSSFRFSTRDLLWAMVVLGLAITLWREHKLRRQYEADSKELGRVRFMAEMALELVKSGHLKIKPEFNKSPIDPPDTDN
jgi:hypothetical protein